jgi:ABC-2 type transport system permease protein
MLPRGLVHSPPVGEILLSVGTIVGTIALFAAISARIFRVGILMTGKRVGLKEMMRRIRY